MPRYYLLDVGGAINTSNIDGSIHSGETTYSAVIGTVFCEFGAAETVDIGGEIIG